MINANYLLLALLALPTETAALIQAPRLICRRRPSASASGCLYRSLPKSASIRIQNLELQALKQVESNEEGASIPNLTVSLVKSIVGGGVLALPASVVCVGDTLPQAIPTAILLIVVLGIMNAYYFGLIGKVCAWTDATSYGEAWDRTVNTGSIAVAATVTAKTALACLAFSIILADSMQSLAVTAGLDSVTRPEALLAVTTFTLLPLCLLRELSSLSKFSAAGIAGFSFTLFTMITRFLDGSYEAGGQYLVDLPENFLPGFGNSPSLLPEAQGVCVLACTLATAYVAAYNAPRFRAELRDNTVRRFNIVVYTAYTIAAVVFVIVAAIGFATFGSHAQPLILNNYSPSDPLAAISKTLLAASIVLTYPLPFVGLRDGFLDAFQVPESDRTDQFQNTLTIGLLATVTAVALVVKDLALVLSVGGGTFSTLVASVFPVLMFRAAVEQRADGLDEVDRKREEAEANTALLLMSISVTIGVIGVSFALKNAIG
jgi:amino acid permease